MRLFHVAEGFRPRIREFIPQVPKSANFPEDTVTPRICFSETIEGCLTALGYTFHEHHPLTIWEVDIDPKAAVSPKFLWEHHLVPDCLLTGEWWVLRPLTLVGTHVYLEHFEVSRNADTGVPVYRNCRIVGG